MKKLLCAFLAAAMLLLLAACGPAATKKAPEPTPTPTQAAPPAQTPEPAPEPSPEPGPEPTPLAEPSPEPEAPAEEPSEPDYSTGTPWLFSNLDGIVTADTPAELKDDFGLYVNKDALVENVLQGDTLVSGTVYEPTFQCERDLAAMFRGDRPQDPEAQAAYDLFHLFKDWDSRNARGMEPLRELTEQLEAVNSLEELTAYFLDTPVWERNAALWSFYVSADPDDSSRQLLFLEDNGSQDEISSKMLFLEDSALYTGEETKNDRDWVMISELIQKLLRRMGYSGEEAVRVLDNCFSFELMLAQQAIPSTVEKYELYYSLAYDSFTREELLAIEGALPVLEELERMGIPAQDKYYAPYPGFLEGVASLYTEENLPLIRDYLIAHEVYSAAWYLDRIAFDWYLYYVTSAKDMDEPKQEDVIFATAVSERLPWPTARLYTETYLTEEDKEDVTALVEELREAFRGILTEADFLSDATKEKAIEKLDGLEALVLYPDDWEPYSCPELTIAGPEEGGMLWEALCAAKEQEFAGMLRLLGRPTDRAEWLLPPQIDNCFYIPETNCIMISGAFSRGGLYSSDMPLEEKLGKLGIVIAHEISHSFDSSGAYYDALGNVADWWTPEDKAEFQNRVERLETYYSNIHPWEGFDLPAAILTGEACADMAGMKCILRVASETEDFDYDAFFRTYADLWMMEFKVSLAPKYLSDPHPQGYLRINSVLQQFDEFLDYYGITEGDGMYLAPEDRVAIW